MADKFKFNPFTGNLDNVGDNTQSAADLRYVKKSGDTMTGDLDLQTYNLVLKASDGTRWGVTINTDGSLVTTLITAPPIPTTGNPIGLLLALTYS